MKHTFADIYWNSKYEEYVLRRLKTHYNDPEKECAKVRKKLSGGFLGEDF